MTRRPESTIHSVHPRRTYANPYISACRADYLYAKRTIRAWYLCLIGGATAVYLITLTQPLWLSILERSAR